MRCADGKVDCSIPSAGKKIFSEAFLIGYRLTAFERDWELFGTVAGHFWNEIGIIWGSIWIRYGTILDPFGSSTPRPRDVHWAVHGTAFPHDKGGHCNVQKPYQRQERLKTACP